jgi:D-sedoheptulose 7-phosphate isomerase
MFVKKYFKEIEIISRILDFKKLEKLVSEIYYLKNKGGRIFFLGLGGSAANCSHAVNDFRKLCNIECYSPTDNVSELTARINDEGFKTSFSKWLNVSKLNSNDALFIFSVGGGNIKKKVSINIIDAIKFSKKRGAKIFGVVGRDGGYTKKKGNTVIIIPKTDNEFITPIVESYQAIIWHYLVSHPKIKENKTKW